MKRAEITSSNGAGVLRCGLGLLLVRYLEPYTVPVLVLGALLHGWGMLDKHRIERASLSDRLRWVEVLYWVCWVALALLVAYITGSALQPG